MSERIDALEARVTEIESRLAEAGRRVLFHADRERKGEDAVLASLGKERPEDEAFLSVFLADLGRALLFDTETPDKEEGA